MVRYTFLVIIFLIAWIGFFSDRLCAQSHTLETGDELLPAVRVLPDVAVEKIDLELKITQPLDHNHPDQGTFEQRLFLTHKGFDKPTVLWLEGYAARGNQLQEISKLLDANQIIVEHRYFGQSRPDSLDWHYLTIEQAAADHHHVVQTFKNIYHGKWLSAGISKGGQTTMYHRRFYPDDVDASVCYVAPLNFSDEEPRVYTFLKNVGSDTCRRQVRSFQKLLLSHRNELLPRFKKYLSKKKYTFKMGPEKAFEYCVLEYEFSFWQWHKDGCGSIPPAGAPIEDIFDHFVEISDPYFFSDQGIEYYQPFFYQALTQIGFYGYDLKAFDGLLQKVTAATFHFSAPPGTEPQFDPRAMQDIYDWISTGGRRMIFIYGEQDPWAASAVQLNGQPDMLKMVLKGGDHRTRILDFPEEQRRQIFRKLEEWMGVKIKGELKI